MFSVGRIAAGASRRASSSPAISRLAAPALAPIPGQNASSRCNNPHPAPSPPLLGCHLAAVPVSNRPKLTAGQQWLVQQVYEVGWQHAESLQRYKRERLTIMDGLYAATSTSR